VSTEGSPGLRNAASRRASCFTQARWRELRVPYLGFQ